MKRILLKISGESFQGGGEKGIDLEAVKKVAQLIESLIFKKYEIVIVVGGGNIYRGRKLIQAGLNPTDSHNMSMLSTVFNAVALKNVLSSLFLDCIILDALHIEFLQDYTSDKGKKYIEQGKILILSSGTGNPFFSTDTAGVLRAIELSCDAMIKLTKVEGVYDKDPLEYPDAHRFETISYNQFLEKNLQVFDHTGIILARDNKLPIFVMKTDDISSLLSVLSGGKGGTKIF